MKSLIEDEKKRPTTRTSPPKEKTDERTVEEATAWHITIEYFDIHGRKKPDLSGSVGL